MIFAFLIGFFSLWYTNNLVEKLEVQERENIHTWANATRLIASPDYEGDFNFLYQILQSNTTIPVILTNTEGEITSFRNLDSTYSGNMDYLLKKIEEMKADNEPIEIAYLEGEKFTIYYEDSILLNKLRFYPYFQLGIIGLFLVVSYFSFSYSRTSEQNKVWAGMSKETAHQLGTPISSLMGWIDYLKEGDNNLPQKVIDEMSHDLNRLELITERFSKIGSEPVLSPINLREVLNESINYINSRTSEKVQISIDGTIEDFKEVSVNVNRPLFAWVIENLCKNAVDAMDGEGSITFSLSKGDNKVYIDVLDTGKGIPSNKFKTIFKPGFTTKKRGWGLGLSLVKRIIENYHNGKIYVKSSDIGKGTKFRIELKTN
ncbi:MAG: HAMP domain-containing histidine kinase [Bacteroidia bacterium]|nr:HAMP domain-containing histidine kinase [Bacteroidia bacterium]